MSNGPATISQFKMEAEETSDKAPSSSSAASSGSSSLWNASKETSSAKKADAVDSPVAIDVVPMPAGTKSAIPRAYGILTGNWLTDMESYKRAEKWTCPGCHFKNHVGETHCCRCLRGKPDEKTIVN